MKSFFLKRGLPIFEDFIWGEDWRYIFPTGSRLVGLDKYFPTETDQTPDGIFFYNRADLYGTTDYRARLGATHISYQGYEIDWTTPVGELQQHDVLTKFILYYGEWNGNLPTEFTEADITSSLLTNNGLSGSRILYLTTSRNIQLDFPETEHPKYRIIAVPMYLYSEGINVSNNHTRTYNRLRYINNTDVTLVPGPNILSAPDPSTPIPAYSGYPYSDNEILFGDGDFVAYYIYVMPSSSLSSSVYLRHLTSLYENLTMYDLNLNSYNRQFIATGSFSGSHASFGPIYNGTTNRLITSSFIRINSCSQLNPVSGTLLSVEIRNYAYTNFTHHIENFDSVTRSLNSQISESIYFSIPGLGTFDVRQLSRSRGPATAAVFDGTWNYLGASGWFDSGDSQVNPAPGTYIHTIYTGSNLGFFTGSGSVNFNVSRSLNIKLYLDSVDAYQTLSMVGHDILVNSGYFIDISMSYHANDLAI